MWGGEDLIADLGGRSSRTPQGRYYPLVEHARFTVRLAAGAAGKPAVDSVHIDIADLGGLARESNEAVDLGFAAKACIHPSHVPGHPQRVPAERRDDRLGHCCHRSGSNRAGCLSVRGPDDRRTAAAAGTRNADPGATRILSPLSVWSLRWLPPRNDADVWSYPEPADRRCAHRPVVGWSQEPGRGRQPRHPTPAAHPRPRLNSRRSPGRNRTGRRSPARRPPPPGSAGRRTCPRWSPWPGSCTRRPRPADRWRRPRPGRPGGSGGRTRSAVPGVLGG